MSLKQLFHHAEGEQWNCNKCFQVIVVFLPKGAITEVILVYDLNAIKYLHGDAKFSREFCMGISNSCMGMPNSLANFAWGFRIL